MDVNPKQRSRHSTAFKAQVLAARSEPGASVAAVALSFGLNACDEPVQTFQAFTADLERMADWLVAMGIETVAMESTGVYWIPAYEILCERGIEVVVCQRPRSERSLVARAMSTMRNGCSG